MGNFSRFEFMLYIENFIFFNVSNKKIACGGFED